MSIQRKTTDLGPGKSQPEATRPTAQAFARATSRQTQLTVRIDGNLHRRFRLAALTENTSMSEVVETLVADWLDQLDHKK